MGDIPDPALTRSRPGPGAARR
ncbi:hypothetical protein ARTHRO8AJ_40021 [Arthrobacter sp. 8AJ]|nr:hypothetical protein ARTHRO8AJ_40021 [Arthrobacter sp. 8AJ]